MLRKLNERESYLWMIGQDHPFLIQFMIQLKGKINPEEVNKTLQVLQQRHLLLQCTITKEKPYTFYKNAIPLNYIPHVRENEKTSEKISLDIINQKIPDTDVGTFLRVDWISDEINHEFIFTIDHAFSDGSCFFELIKSFLIDLNQIQQNNFIEPTSYEDRINILNYLPENIIKLEENATIKHLQSYTSDSTLKEYATVSPHLIQLSKEESTRVFKTAKQHHISVHGLLSAALIQTLNDYLVEENKFLNALILSPIDTRKYLTGNIQAFELGNYASGITHAFTVNQLMPGIKIAESVTKEIKYIYQTSYIADILKAFSEKSNHNTNEYQRLKMHDNSNTISNLGKIDIPTQYSKFEFISWRFNANSPFMCNSKNFFWFIVCTINDKLQIDVIPPLLLEEKNILENYANNFYENLKNLCV